jgi:hypothetical protein
MPADSRNASAICAAVRISPVYEALGGPKLRGNRGPAFWRDGDGYNVTLNDTKNAWHDFASGEGGGVLDLIQKVRGGTRAEALRWLADLTGILLVNRQLTPRERAEYTRERATFERDLRQARHWQRAAVLLFEETLVVLKASLFDPTAERVDFDGITSLTQLLACLRSARDAVLVKEYRTWRESDPTLTGGMVRLARDREDTDRRGLRRFIERASRDSTTS